MLGLAKRCGARVFQASTSEIYGDPSLHPQPEHYWGNVNPIGPRSCYDEGKRCAETLFFDYRRQHKVAHQGRAHLQHLRTAPRTRTTVASCRASSSRPCATRTSRSSAKAGRPAPSATSTTSIEGFSEADVQPGRGHRADQSRQSGRVHHPRTGQHRGRTDRARARKSCIAGCRRTILASAARIFPKPSALLGWRPTIALREGLERTIPYFEALLSEGRMPRQAIG